MQRRLWLLAGVACRSSAGGGLSDRDDQGRRQRPDARHWLLPRSPSPGRTFRGRPRPARPRASSSSVRSRTSRASTSSTPMRMLSGPRSPASSPIIRGAYIIDQKRQLSPRSRIDGRATKTTLTITIRPDANWNWGGKKIPVTNKDLVYTWQQIVDPKNNIAATTGYDQITGYTLKGTKTDHLQVEEAVRGLSATSSASSIPSQALAGLDFNKIWSNCVCGNDGKPVSDGPFMLTNYTRGPGLDAEGEPATGTARSRASPRSTSS